MAIAPHVPWGAAPDLDLWASALDGLDDLDAPHVAEAERSPMPLERGGRIERKPYRNKDGMRRIYYVFRWEKKKDGQRHRPTRYLGKSPDARPERARRDVPHAAPHAA